MASTLHVEHFAQLRDVTLEFADLTVLVGPQATGKSLVLQLLKLAVDSSSIGATLERQGFGWENRHDFCAVYFGEGMADAWSDETRVRFDGRVVQAPPTRRRKAVDSRLFYIPAHRTLSVAEGWPAGFRSYKPDTPFVVREFSEVLLDLLTTRRGTDAGVIFPQDRRLKGQFRERIDQAVFHGGQLKLIADGPRRQFKIVYPNAEIAYMAWTAGQREFIPLLLGLYHLLPARQRTKVQAIDWVVIEEPEMGLHPKAIEAVMLLILELMHRGYRVALSTHSSAVLEVVWALKELARAPELLWDVFDVASTSRRDYAALAKHVVAKRCCAYHFDYDGNHVACHNISDLDPGSTSIFEQSWGGLTSLSARVNEAVAEAAGRAR